MIMVIIVVWGWAPLGWSWVHKFTWQWVGLGWVSVDEMDPRTTLVWGELGWRYVQCTRSKGHCYIIYFQPRLQRHRQQFETLQILLVFYIIGTRTKNFVTSSFHTPLTVSHDRPIVVVICILYFLLWVMCYCVYFLKKIVYTSSNGLYLRCYCNTIITLVL